MNSNRQPKATKPLLVDFSRAGVCVLESHHAKGFTMPWTKHSFHNLLHIIGGRGRLLWKGGGLDLRPGDFVFMRKGFRHRIEDQSANPLSLYAVCVEKKVLQGYRPVKKLAVCRTWRMNQELRSILREMLMEQGSNHPEEEVMLHSLAARLVVRISRQGTGSRKANVSEPEMMDSRARVEVYARELAVRFFEDDSLDEAARRAGVSRRSLTSHFRAITGYSRQTYIRHLRIDHARHLLATTDRTIEAVAFECGFNDLSHFYRSFKMEEGRSPKIYRQQSSIG